jgi:hypothetical protein
MHNKVKGVEEAITPGMATKFLEEAEQAYEKAKLRGEKEARLYDPRTLSWDKIHSYSHDMKNGRWRVTDQGIGFDQDGVLLNGFHRMWASIASERSFRTLVVRGLKREESLEAIDRGKVRSVRDHIKMIHGLKYPNHMAALIGVVVKHFTGEEKIVSNAMADIVIGCYRKEMVHLADYIKTNTKRLVNPMANGAFVISLKASVEATIPFIDGYYNGIGLKRDDPILKIRNYVGNMEAKELYRRKKDIGKYYFLALRKHFKGEKLKKLWVEDSAFEWFKKRNQAELETIRDWCEINAPAPRTMRGKLQDRTTLLKKIRDTQRKTKAKQPVIKRRRAGKTQRIGA